MRPFILRAAVLAAMLCVCAPAIAAPILVDDFQDGVADGWGATGAGDVRLTTYGDNVSLRVTGGATALTAVSTRGFVQVSVAGSLAAMGLGKADACLVEASADDGASWREVVAVRDGADDGVTLTRAALALPGADDNPRLLIRVRAVGGRRVSCWADAVTVTGERTAGATDGPRADLAFDGLASGPALTGPVPLTAFTPPADAEVPAGRFTARLTLDVSAATLAIKVLHDATGDTPAELAARLTLPPFDFELVQDGADLVPVRRGVAVGDHPAWDWVIEPGRVWREASDRGWLRASVPFALQERNANCLHNGVLTFLFKPDGSISRVAMEIASETCAYLKFDAWATVPARLAPTAVPDADAVVAAWRDEVSARLPVRPLAELATLRPDLNLAAFALAAPTDGDPPSAYGLVVDGVHYAGACQTRHGDYPFCDVLDLPSYSTAKSIVGGVGLMRIEALHPGSALALIADHVPACADADWRGVTLANALDMATGVYGSTAFEADENAPTGQVFFDVEDHAAKAAYACGHFHRRAAPGKTFVYHTADTYLLGSAMSDLLRDAGEGDLYDDLVAPLWRSLWLSPTIMTTRRTYDAARQPFTGWGLTYHRDDILRIAGWLEGGAVIDGRPALDAGLLAAALQKDPAHPGLPAGGAAYRYKAGFWARDIGGPLGCSRPVWAPFMSGFGGISVVLLPGGVTYYYFGDSGVFDWAPAAVEAARIRDMCS